MNLDSGRTLFELADSPLPATQALSPEPAARRVQASDARPEPAAHTGQPRIVVLGANGFIGSQLVAALARSGWAQVLAGYHLQEGEVPASVEARRIDSTAPEQMTEALRGADGVVNCVASDPGTMLEGARVLFEAAARMPVRPRIVHMSSMTVYGSAVAEVGEGERLNGDLGAYSAAKVAAEALAQDYQEAVCLRPGIVYGPGSRQWTNDIGQLLASGRLGDLGANGEGLCNLVHVDDVVTAIEQSLRAPGVAGEAINLSMPEPITWNDYFARFAEALGYGPVRRITPLRLGLERAVVGPALKVSQIALKKLKLPTSRLPPLLSPSQLRLFRQRISLRTERAEALLGMRWLSIDEGLRATAAAHPG